MSKLISLEDTIAAISTPIGESGVGIVRLSGKNALAIADKIFKSKNGKKPSEFQTFTTHYGYIGVNSELIDEVILTVMRAPRTYTREDVVEINCHSGVVPLKRILDLTISSGARLAQPGEFTKRAYLNGRIDLSQAEAVLDIIKSRTDRSLKCAFKQLEGGLSKEINSLRDKILDISANLEARIDFPDDITSPLELNSRVDDIIKNMERLVSSFEQGQILREGLSMVICGKPNVGKSSLMNALLKKNRVIVTPLPGTTRDTIEEQVDIKGLALRIIDTAGLTEETDYIGYLTAKRADAMIAEADLILFMLDASRPLSDEDKRVADKIKDKKLIVVINKIDLPLRIKLDQIKKAVKAKKIVKISATRKTGLELLEEAILEMVFRGKPTLNDNEPLVSNLRHKDALVKTLEFMIKVQDGLKQDALPEIIAFDLKDAMDSLGTVSGETTSEDLLEQVFSQFCIGK
ncbi:MAG: tRNA uridine-5-carboxymethylaminomethyl(34) synthesis GTPase MnmE [Candidatus Omnitrophota bacterium]|nr:tRNA uridine-5-carboxymethylaminomethyl(34) synthesis GTPase MnmE [Candidatus Omnitrophota bacterium]